MSLRKSRNKWRQRVVVGLVFGVTMMLCCIGFVEFIILTEKGEGIIETGSAVVITIPETDEEFVLASMLFLEEIGWWQNDPDPGPAAPAG